MDKLPKLGTFLVENSGKLQKYSIGRLAFAVFMGCFCFVWTKTSLAGGTPLPIDLTITALILALLGSQAAPKLMEAYAKKAPPNVEVNTQNTNVQTGAGTEVSG